MRRAGVAETVVISVIMFLGTGVYKMYSLHKEVNYYKQKDAKVQTVQDKYCNMPNPTYEQQAVCIDMLKANIREEKK